MVSATQIYLQSIGLEFRYLYISEKIGKIQKHCPRIACNDFASYHDTLLWKNGKVKMKMRRFRILAFEVFTQVTQTISKNYRQKKFKLRKE